MRFTIKLDVFNMGFFFFIGENEKEHYIKATNGEDKDISPFSKGVTFNNAIWLSEIDLPILVHEVHHAKHFLVKELGIHDEETEAYIMAYVIREALNKINKLEGK